MKIQQDASVEATEGDFGAVGKDLTLHVAPKVFGVVRALGARTAESLYDQVVEAPAVFADALDWSEAEVARAITDLRAEITRVRPGYFEQELTPASELGLGAMPPRSR